MDYRYLAAEQFWKNFYNLSPKQKESTRSAWQIFKSNPFDSRLKSHKIHSLSSFYKKTIYAVVIESDLRVIFYIESNTVWTVDIGTHDIYKT